MSKRDVYMVEYANTHLVSVGAILAALIVAYVGAVTHWIELVTLLSVWLIAYTDMDRIKDRAKLEGIDLDQEISKLGDS